MGPESTEMDRAAPRALTDAQCRLLVRQCLDLVVRELDDMSRTGASSVGILDRWADAIGVLVDRRSPPLEDYTDAELAAEVDRRIRATPPADDDDAGVRYLFPRRQSPVAAVTHDEAIEILAEMRDEVRAQDAIDREAGTGLYARSPLADLVTAPWSAHG